MSNPFLEKIEPYLLSDQKIVQEFVLQALKEYPLTPAEWTNRVLEMALHSEERRIDLLLGCKSNTVNENSIPLLLNLLKVTEKQRRHLIIEYFKHLQPEIIMEHEQELSSVFGKDVFAFHQFLIHADENELRNEYDAVLSLLESKEFYDHQLYFQAKQIQDKLLLNQWYDVEHIDNILDNELNRSWFSFRGLLAVRAAGILKVEKYIPVLAGLLERDDDILLEETNDALSMYQSDQVAEAVAPFAMKDETSIFASSVLANTKTKQAEEALFSSYQHLDMDGKAMVIEGLAHHLSEKAFPLIEDYIKNGYTTRLFEMEPIYYGLHTVLGKNHPNMEKWKADYEEKEMRFNNLRLNMPAFKTPKIGRNEKCPCGSGKKYKKCCGA